MTSLFANAVISIRMGVEDYEQEDEDRALSAVRNLYAGVLLLAKEALIRAAPKADPREIIGTVFKPVPDGSGGVDHVATGHRTIDFDTIGRRFRDFDLSIDHKALEELNSIRNDIEHHYTEKPEAAIRTAIAKAFPVIASLFRQIGEDPVAHLGPAWMAMLAQRTVYEEERAAARATLAGVLWHASFMAQAELRCPECGSELLEQIDAENTSQADIEFRCRNCGDTPEVEDAVEAAVESTFGTEAYLRTKDAGEDGPIYDCPACDRPTYIESEDICAACGEVMDFTSECYRCSNPISIQDFLDGLDEGLCGYCTHQADKIMRE